MAGNGRRQVENEPIVRYCQSLQGTRVGFCIEQSMFRSLVAPAPARYFKCGRQFLPGFQKRTRKIREGRLQPRKIPFLGTGCYSPLPVTQPGPGPSDSPGKNYPSIPRGQSHDGIDLKKIFLLRVEAIQNGLRRRRESYAGQAERGGWGKNAG